jgi:cell fate regulator YaaT (PSP1 superfamily)
MEGNDEARVPAAVGVSFKRGGKVYTFDANGVRVQPGDFVLARTERGVDIGEVLAVRTELTAEEQSKPLKPLVRRATRDDLRREERLREREKEAADLCEAKIREHKLPMKLVEADYTFDGQRLVFFFSSEGRVDFRNLVRDLAELFRCRIELRQIGVRDEAKMVGGLGPCGRPLCCAQWLRNFDPVGIKVAKDQGMPLNPAKISGICDRLMCCLKYEHAVYLELAARLPQVGDEVRCQGKIGRTRERVLLKEHVVVEFRETDTAEFVQVGADSLRRSKGYWTMLAGGPGQPAEPGGPPPEGSAPAAPQRPAHPIAPTDRAGRSGTIRRSGAERPAPVREAPAREAPVRDKPGEGRRGRTYAAVEDFERNELALETAVPVEQSPASEASEAPAEGRKRRPRRRGRARTAGDGAAQSTAEGQAMAAGEQAASEVQRQGQAKSGEAAQPRGEGGPRAPGEGRKRPPRRRERPAGSETGGAGQAGPETPPGGGTPPGAGAPPAGAPGGEPEGASASASRRARWRRRRPRGEGQLKGDGGGAAGGSAS